MQTIRVVKVVMRLPAPAPDTSAWLVATKLDPPLMREDTIRRPRLEEALRQSVGTLPLTLLSAPAGYGKTTMLARLPELLPDCPLAWITLDTEDNDPVRFFSLIATALGRLHPECGRSAWPWLSGGSGEGTDLKRAVGGLINDILQYLPDPFLLVLDDLHFVTEPAVYVALEYLLDHQPPQLHLAIGTRHDPPLRLARLAARRQLAELRRPDLAFRPAEAGQLLNETLALRLSDAEVTALQERTEGWPAGLCLVAGPLGRLDSPSDRAQFLATLAHSERYALDFLAEEVLRYLPDELRLFLLRTSVLAEMTPSACQAVTGRADAEEVLEGLYRQNLTVASLTAGADEEPVYRHHALFARLLSRQLERELPGELVELHRKAARVQKTPGRAIAHYLSAGLWEEAAQLMMGAGMQLLHSGLSETFRSWYEALPAQTRTAHPLLTTLMGRCEIHRGDYDAAAALLNQAREASAASGDAPAEAEALTSLITIAYQNNERAAAAALVERAATLPLKPLGRVGTRLARAWLHLADCDWDAARRDIEEALAVPRLTRIPACDVLGITYLSAPLAAIPGCLDLVEEYAAEASARALPETAWRLGAEELGAWPLLWRGRIDEALTRAQTAENLRQNLGGYPFVGNDLPVILTVLYLARGDAPAAGQAADTLVRRIEKAPRGKLGFYLHAAGRALALLGRSGEAKAFSQRLAAQRDASPLAGYLCDHLAGLCALVERRCPEAEAALDRAARLEAELPVAWVGGSARLLQARLLLDRGRASEAVAMASPVLRAWEQANTPGCVLLDGPGVLAVLRAAAQQADTGAARLLRLFPAASPAPSSPLPEPLTQRERDVLALIVAGRTNRQISEELYITLDTVKSHVAHILQKLDVTSRTQAALRGRELGF